jgi:hypothetical protein
MALRVLVDGTPLAEPVARAFWQRFSAWMDEHKGDLAGFAKAEGLASVNPELHGGEPVLVASHTAPQVAYTTAPSKRGHAPSPGPPSRTRPGRRR